VLCPDTKLAIVQAKSQGKVSLSVQLKGIKLDTDAVRISPPKPRPAPGTQPQGEEPAPSIQQ
jgi:hypothetical protein